MPNNDFVKSGGLLFLEQSIVNFGGSIFWLIVSQLVFASEIGEVVTVLSIVMLTTTIIGLGIEYPLLKNSARKPQVMTTALIIELIISLASIPIFMLVITDVLGFSSQGILFIALGLLITTPIGNVLRYSLLGVSKVKSVLVVFVTATVIKLASVFVLLSFGLGSLGILIAFLLFAVSVLIPSFLLAVKRFGLTIRRMEDVWSILKSSLANAPGKIRPITRYLVILLPVFGLEESKIGIFFIALVISWVVGSLATSLAQMVIPASTKSKTDLSAESMRISLGLTSPLIVALIIAPESILSIIGSEYTIADKSLFVLLLSIIPLIVTVNSISRFNNLNQTKEIAIVGLLQISVLITTFVFFVPNYGILGASFSVLAASSASAILCLLWSGRQQFRYTVTSIISVSVGWGTGFAISSLLHFYLPLAILSGMIVSFFIILGLKTLSVSEISSALKIKKK